MEDDFYDPFGEDNQPDPPPSVAPPSSPPTESPCTPVPPSSATVRQPPATGNQQHGQDTSASPVVSIFCRRRPVLASQQPCGSQRCPQRTREEKLDDFLQKGCGCRTECYKQITQEHYLDTMERCAELTHDELDLVLLGQLMANIHLSEVVGPQSNHAASPRQVARVDFYHHGRKFCRSTFLMLHGIGKSCFGVK